MKLSPATLLVLIMFGSFAVVLTAMVVFFVPRTDRPAKRTSRGRVSASAHRPEARKSPPEPADDLKRDTLQAPSGSVAEKPLPPPEKTLAETRPAARPPDPARGLYRDLRKMRKELRDQKSEFERRLRVEITTRENKLAQLARWCEALEPGEAAQLLKGLDDRTVAEVLGRMKRERALPIAAVFKRLGREGAISFKE